MPVYTIRDVFDRRSEPAFADRIALVDGTRRVTYRELRQRSLAYAGVLRNTGVVRGDRVGIFLRRSVEAVAALFGTWSIGGVAVIINDALRTLQVGHILTHSEATCRSPHGLARLATSSIICWTMR